MSYFPSVAVLSILAGCAPAELFHGADGRLECRGEWAVPRGLPILANRTLGTARGLFVESRHVALRNEPQLGAALAYRPLATSWSREADRTGVVDAAGRVFVDDETGRHVCTEAGATALDVSMQGSTVYVAEWTEGGTVEGVSTISRSSATCVAPQTLRRVAGGQVTSPWACDGGLAYVFTNILGRSTTTLVSADGGVHTHVLPGGPARLCHRADGGLFELTSHGLSVLDCEGSRTELLTWNGRIVSSDCDGERVTAVVDEGDRRLIVSEQETGFVAEERPGVSATGLGAGGWSARDGFIHDALGRQVESGLGLGFSDLRPYRGGSAARVSLAGIIVKPRDADEWTLLSRPPGATEYDAVVVGDTLVQGYRLNNVYLLQTVSDDATLTVGRVQASDVSGADDSLRLTRWTTDDCSDRQILGVAVQGRQHLLVRDGTKWSLQLLRTPSPELITEVDDQIVVVLDRKRAVVITADGTQVDGETERLLPAVKNLPERVERLYPLGQSLVFENGNGVWRASATDTVKLASADHALVAITNSEVVLSGPEGLTTVDARAD